MVIQGEEGRGIPYDIKVRNFPSTLIQTTYKAGWVTTFIHQHTPVGFLCKILVFVVFHRGLLFL